MEMDDDKTSSKQALYNIVFKALCNIVLKGSTFHI